MANEGLRPPNQFHIPRKTWPSGGQRALEETLKQNGIPEDQAKSLAAALTQHAEQQLLDEEANYNYIEDSLGLGEGFTRHFVDDVAGTGKTWIVPEGVEVIYVELTGAGGGGGGCTDTTGHASAGGAGGWTLRRYLDVTPGQTLGYDLGAGGAGGAGGTTPGNGSSGGPSKLFVPAGAGSPTLQAPSGAGGAASQGVGWPSRGGVPGADPVAPANTSLHVGGLGGDGIPGHAGGYPGFPGAGGGSWVSPGGAPTLVTGAGRYGVFGSGGRGVHGEGTALAGGNGGDGVLAIHY